MSNNIAFIFIIALLAVVISTFALKLGRKDTFDIPKNQVPLPPRPISSLLSYLSGNQTADFDTTLMAYCTEYFDYIIKYIDRIPTNWVAKTIIIAVKKSGFTGKNINEALNYVTSSNPTKADVIAACKKIRPECKYLYTPT